MNLELKTKYEKEIVPSLCTSRGYKNQLQVPCITKVVVNMGFDMSVDKDTFKHLVDDLARITGQRPVYTKARQSISNFKLREGVPIGAKVTLRGKRMFDFLGRLIHVTLPRIRDFRGVSAKSFDRQGNYTLGLNEQMLFPEINPDHVKRTQGMDVTIVTTAHDRDEAFEMLKLLGMPFAAA